MKKVGIVMGSDSDLPILRKAMDTLDELGISYEAHVYSAHRTPEQARQFALHARENGFGALIAAAGMAAHLAGAIAARCPPAYLSPLLPSMEVSMPLCLLLKSWLSAMRRWLPGWMPSALPTVKRCWRKTLRCN